jgi:hypothetical protein
MTGIDLLESVLDAVVGDYIICIDIQNGTRDEVDVKPLYLQQQRVFLNSPLRELLGLEKDTQYTGVCNFQAHVAKKYSGTCAIQDFQEENILLTIRGRVIAIRVC